MFQSLVESRIGSLPAESRRALAVVLPNGRRVGAEDAAVRLTLSHWGSLWRMATGQIGGLGADYVEGRLAIDGPMRRVVEVATELLPFDPTFANELSWFDGCVSRWRHRPASDARQIQHHYDVSDDFYALWLDPRRVYSCAYYRAPGLSLAEAQEAKLEHICRKLDLKAGERFLDIGAGWGGLLLWAAEHYGVRATGITLSKNQHAHVGRLIEERGLGGRVRMLLLDYRALPEDEPYDKIASVGMFEHVGRARLATYFAKIRRLLKPGGLLLNHGITAGGTRNRELGGGLGEFVGRYIFPGGELEHVSHVLRVLAEAGLEGLDTENLRPHYARTLWAWSDALEANLARAQAIAGEKTVRAYRLYLAGSAAGFERGWMALHQTLAMRPSGRIAEGALRGAQSSYPWTRDHIYR